MRGCTLLEHKIRKSTTESEFLNPVYTTGTFALFLQSCLYVISPRLAPSHQSCHVFIFDPCPLYIFFYFPTYLRSSWHSLKGWHTLWRLILEGVLEGNTYATPRNMVQLSCDELRFSSRKVETHVNFGRTPKSATYRPTVRQGPERNSCPLSLLVSPGK